MGKILFRSRSIFMQHNHGEGDRSAERIWGDGYCKGWAPDKAYRQLSKARLDRWLSLTYLISQWLNDNNKKCIEAIQIMGWTNLGALVESAIKLFLTVYIDDYTKDKDAPKNKKGLIDPENLTLESLRIFFQKRKLL